MAKVLLAVAMIFLFSAGFFTGRSWRTWGEDLEIDPATVVFAGFCLFASLALLFARSAA